MSDFKLKYEVIADDGEDGIFFRDGGRWIRTGGKEVSLLTLAPHLERKYTPTKAEEKAIELSR